MIRKANINDINRIYELGNKYSDTFYKTYDLEKYLYDDIYIINVYDDKEVNGFIICTKMYNVVEILLIYVEEKSRGKHVGKSLLESIKNDCEKIILEVSNKNLPAYRLYKNFGFNIINIRKGYYKDADAYVMELVV